MQFELIQQHAYTVAKVMMQPGETIRAESGAMMAMSANIEIQSKMQGGLGGALSRTLGGESLFQTNFICHQAPGEVMLAAATPGDIIATETGMGMMVTSGCFLACDPTINLQLQASMKGFFGGEGLFMMKADGPGTLLLSSFGGIIPVQLQPGQPYVVDTGHLVAFSAGMGFEVRRASKSLLGSLTSGEGYVVNLTGPGVAFLQTRTPNAFGSYISQFVPRGG
jgi:uncharacterized protein (TIGR00266 family)